MQRSRRADTSRATSSSESVSVGFADAGAGALTGVLAPRIALDFRSKVFPGSVGFDRIEVGLGQFWAQLGQIKAGPWARPEFGQTRPHCAENRGLKRLKISSDIGSRLMSLVRHFTATQRVEFVRRDRSCSETCEKKRAHRRAPRLAAAGASPLTGADASGEMALSMGAQGPYGC